MATISDLPSELLLEIFSHYIQSEGRAKFLKNVAPVCKTWNALCSASPLWKDIHKGTWSDLLYFSDRGLLHHTRSLKIPRCYFYTACRHPHDLSTVLPNIRDLRALDMNRSTVSKDTMMIVAKYCPNLEELGLTFVRGYEHQNISLNELDPILAVCGPKLKYLDLSCCYLKETEHLITEIAARCSSLERFKLMNAWSKYMPFEIVFPIKQLQRGCPQLRELEFYDCSLVTNGWSDSCGFENLTVFIATRSRFHGMDVYSLLKNSRNLEYLHLNRNIDLTFAKISEISSNKVKVLNLDIRGPDANFKSVERAVQKWKSTLRHLFLGGCEFDVMSVLESLTHDDHTPKLEKLLIEIDTVDPHFFTTFVLKCQNLKEILIQPHNYARYVGTVRIAKRLDDKFHIVEGKTPLRRMVRKKTISSSEIRQSLIRVEKFIASLSSILKFDFTYKLRL